MQRTDPPACFFVSGLILTKEIETMAYAKLSVAECNAIHIVREMGSSDVRKQVKREVFARAKSAFGIPPAHKLVTETDVQNPDAGLLRNKATRETYELNAEGKWIGAAAAVAAKRWFRLNANNLHSAITEALDAQHSMDQPMSSMVAMPVNRMVLNAGTEEALVIDMSGNVWVKLDEDTYDTSESSEDDDHDTRY